VYENLIVYEPKERGGERERETEQPKKKERFKRKIQRRERKG
jgi:hypothetical protein